MRKEIAKELSEILMAYHDGKTIQTRLVGNMVSQAWLDLDSEKLDDLNILNIVSHVENYRIKPEPKLIPFTFEDSTTFRDKWVKMGGYIRRITAFNSKGICLENIFMDYLYFSQTCSFEDGSACGTYINIE